MDQQQARLAAQAAVGVLSGRKGFDWWWGELDGELTTEILDAIAEKIAGYPVTMPVPVTARPKVQIVRGEDGVSFYLNGKCLDETAPEQNACYAAESIAKELARALGADVEDADEPDAQAYRYFVAYQHPTGPGSSWVTRPTPIEDADSEREVRDEIAKATGCAWVVITNFILTDGPY